MVVRMVAFAVGASLVRTFAAFLRRCAGVYEAVMCMRRMVVQRMNGRRRQQIADDRENDRNPS
jgi:hypothetical protein